MSALITLKIQRNEKYSVIGLTAVEDPCLDWAAKGLHTYLISRPPDWQIRFEDLLRRSSCGKTALTSAIKKLQVTGYLTILKIKNGNGHFIGSSWEVREDPLVEQKEVAVKAEGFDERTSYADRINPRTAAFIKKAQREASKTV
ncbi:MAG: hypothetical protein ACLQF0_17000 [Dissulfurispiraceae bacterium]